MKKIVGWMCVCLCFHVCGAWAQKSVLRLTDERLMNEVRVAPSPADGEKVTMNPPRFMWPDKFPHLGAVLDGVPGKEEKKPEVMYRVRISQDRNFAKGVIEGEQPWAFFNPFQQLAPGTWYWQYAYVDPKGHEEWSPVYAF